MTMTAQELADRIGAKLVGQGDRSLVRCAPIEEADASAVTFVANQKYARLMKKTKAGAVIVSPKNVERAPEGLTLLVADDPYYAFRQAVVALHGFPADPPPGVHPTACVDPTAKLGKDCHLGPYAVVAAGAVVGDRAVLHAHVHLGAGSSVGPDTVLHPGVKVYHDCAIGARVIIHANSVIGSDGYGFATHKGVHHKIPQVGSVVIEDDVELGALCSVQRGTVGVTRVGAGTKTSDFVDVGHGAVVGKHNLLVSFVGIAGSATLGDYVAIGGQSGVGGHLSVGDRAQIAARSGVITDVPEDAAYGGSPAIPIDQAKQVGMEVVRLPELVKELAHLQQRVRELEERQPDA